jgi:hypothetical protein
MVSSSELTRSDFQIFAAAIGDGEKGFVWKMDAATELLPAIETVLRGKKFISKE